MSNKIESAVAPTVPTAPVRAAASARDPRAEGARGPSSADSVALTSEAQSLQALEQTVRASDGVDSAKVAEVRRLLAEGRYQADPQAIAGKLVQFEQVYP